MKIALVIGHAPDKQGAWGNAGISEYNYWKNFLIDTINQLPQKHQYRIFERPTSKRGYGSRMKLLHHKLDAWGADLSVSFHFNAAGNVHVNGHEVLYCSKRGSKYAKIINDIFTERLRTKNRGTKRKTPKDRGGGFLCRGRSVCILLEPYFAAHQIDYLPGTEGYEALQKSIKEFFDKI